MQKSRVTRAPENQRVASFYILQTRYRVTYMCKRCIQSVEFCVGCWRKKLMSLVCIHRAIAIQIIQTKARVMSSQKLGLSELIVQLIDLCCTMVIAGQKYCDKQIDFGTSFTHTWGL